MKKGLALLELIVGIAIILVLATMTVKLVGNVLHRSRVVSAKAQIAQLALLLEAVKDDTGYYPVSLQDLTRKEAPKCRKEDGTDSIPDRFLWTLGVICIFIKSRPPQYYLPPGLSQEPHRLPANIWLLRLHPAKAD